MIKKQLYIALFGAIICSNSLLAGPVTSTMRRNTVIRAVATAALVATTVIIAKKLLAAPQVVPASTTEPIGLLKIKDVTEPSKKYCTHGLMDGPFNVPVTLPA